MNPRPGEAIALMLELLWSMKAYLTSEVGVLFSSFLMSMVAIVMEEIQIVLGHDQVHGGSLLLRIFLTDILKPSPLLCI